MNDLEIYMLTSIFILLAAFVWVLWLGIRYFWVLPPHAEDEHAEAVKPAENKATSSLGNKIIFE